MPRDRGPADAPERTGPFRFSARHIGTLLGAFATLVVAVTGVVALLYQVAPGLRPQDPPERLAAEITDVLVDPVTLGQYAKRVEDPKFRDELRRALGDDADLRQEMLSRRGVLVYVQMRSQGSDGALAPPQVFFHDAMTGRRLYGEQLETILEGDGEEGTDLKKRLECKLRATDDQCVAGVFKLCDVHVHRVRVRVELRDDEGRLMDLATTKAFPCRILPEVRPV